MSNIQFASTVTSYKRHVDKTVSVTTRSNYEVTHEDLSEIDKIYGNEAWTVIAPNEQQTKDLPVIPAPIGNKMTRSQEVRWLIRQIYDSKPRDIEFADYYEQTMNKIIAQLRSKLDEY